MTTERFIIAHPTDLHPDGGIAFAHGVALARDIGAQLVSVHANPVSDGARRDMPDASNLLFAWGESADRVEHDRIVHTCCDDPVDTLLDALRSVEPQLLVVGTRRPTGLERIAGGSVSESLALNAGKPTLFLPIGGHGFVSEETGAVTLSRVLVPVDSEETALAALQAVDDFVGRLNRETVEIVLLHVGDDSFFEHLVYPERAGWAWRRIQRSGKVRDQVAAVAEELECELIVMATRGHDSVLDAFRGSRTERVVRTAGCPVLSVPLAT